MNVIEDLRDKLNIREDEIEEMRTIIQNMEKEINSHGIYLDPQIRIGFYSHMVSLIRRLKKNDLVVDVADEAIIDQIQKENMELAIDVVKPLFERYQTDYSESEVVLVAIYIQTSNASN